MYTSHVVCCLPADGVPAAAAAAGLGWILVGCEGTSEL
jgi:hypothetical protein